MESPPSAHCGLLLALLSIGLLTVLGQERTAENRLYDLGYEMQSGAHAGLGGSTAGFRNLGFSGYAGYSSYPQTLSPNSYQHDYSGSGARMLNGLNIGEDYVAAQRYENLYQQQQQQQQQQLQQQLQRQQMLQQRIFAEHYYGHANGGLSSNARYNTYPESHFGSPYALMGRYTSIPHSNPFVGYSLHRGVASDGLDHVRFPNSVSATGVNAGNSFSMGSGTGGGFAGALFQPLQHFYYK